MEVSLRRGRTKVRAPQRAPALPARHHQPARLARVSKLASETHEIPCRTPPCALAGSIILSIAGSVLMSVDTLAAYDTWTSQSATCIERFGRRRRHQELQLSLGSTLLLRPSPRWDAPTSGVLAQDAIDLPARDAHLMRDGARPGPLGLERPHPGAVDALDAALVDSRP